MRITYFAVPHQIRDWGEILHLVGEGTIPGSKTYCDTAGRRFEYFVGKVVSLSPRFARMVVEGDEIQDVLIDLPPSWLRVGHIVLFKGPYKEGAQLKAVNVWPTTVVECFQDA
jgi:hypothetical protein